MLHRAPHSGQAVWPATVTPGRTPVQTGKFASIIPASPDLARLADAFQQAFTYQPADQEQTALGVKVLQLLDPDSAPVEEHP